MENLVINFSKYVSTSIKFEVKTNDIFLLTESYASQWYEMLQTLLILNEISELKILAVKKYIVLTMDISETFAGHVQNGKTVLCIRLKKRFKI